MSKIIAENIAVLREEMLKKGYDWFFCTSDDFHASEYVADYFKVREHYTGFTGENAFLLLNKNEAYMWTDGRFFIQADIELKDTGVTLMKMGEPNVPTVLEFLKDNLKKGEVLFFDGRMVSTSWGKNIEDIVNKNLAKLVYSDSLAGDLWTERPSMPSTEVFILGDDISGENTSSKLLRIREKMNASNVAYHFIGSLDDIAWITNMRAMDVECNPVFLSYMLISKEDAVIFMQDSEVSDSVREYLTSNGIKISEYDNVLNFISDSDVNGDLLLDEGSINYACFKLLSEKCNIINSMNPSKVMKAVKNETEIRNLKKAYMLDSVCVTKFIYWLKKNVGKIDITEISAADYLDNLRREVPGFIDLSFPTISGYGSNGAIVHYKADEKSNAKIEPEGMLLVDSGGTYKDGTTDVTRTIACGNVTDKMKLHYSKTAAGMLTLANSKFLKGCTGRNLDILVRVPLWNIGIDFKHGTGHGVGHILNVHEGPQSIRWQYNEKVKEYPFEPGMITSDEPGVYIEGEYGIRIENVILCVEDIKNEYGQFLGFEHLTYVPLDRTIIDVNALSQAEIDLVNEYQKAVYENIKGYLNIEEAEWLRKETLPL